MTNEKIQEYKQKYGTIYEIEVEGKVCYLRSPNRRDLSYISSIKDPIQMSETMLNQLWVEGDEEIKTDDSLFLAVMGQLGEITKVKEATLKKL